MEPTVSIIKLKSTTSPIMSPEDVLIQALTKFYNEDVEYIKILFAHILPNDKKKVVYASETAKEIVTADIEERGQQPALRLYEWFILHYCKENQVNYFVQKDQQMYEHIFVYNHYKAQMSYQKGLFDICGRGTPISIVDHLGNRLKTTVSQLNFFRWAIQYKVVDYVKANLETLKDAMFKYNQDKKTGSGDDQKKKRSVLTVDASKTVTRHNVSVTIKFR